MRIPVIGCLLFFCLLFWLPARGLEAEPNSYAQLLASLNRQYPKLQDRIRYAENQLRDAYRGGDVKKQLDLLLVTGDLYLRDGCYEEALLACHKADTIAVKYKLDVKRGDAYLVMANVLIENNFKFEEMFPLLLKAQDIYHTQKDSAGLGRALALKARLMYWLENYDHAHENNLEAIRLLTNARDTMGMASSIVQQGNIFRYNKRPEAAGRYFEEAIRLLSIWGGDAEQLSRTYCTYAEWRLFSGDIPEAQFYLKKSYEIAVASNAASLLAWVELINAHVYIALEQGEKAIGAVQKAMAHMTLHSWNKMAGELIMCRAYHQTGQADSVYYYGIAASRSALSHYEKLKQWNLAMLENEHAQEKQQQLQLFQKKIYYALIAVLILVVIIVAQFYRTREVQRKKKELLLNLELDMARQKIKLNTEKLHHFINTLVRKNVLLNELKMQLLHKNGYEAQEDEAYADRVEQLINARLLTEAEWDDFKRLFERVHKDFFNKLRDKYPDLSKAEMRLAALLKLGIESTDEIANMLGVSPSTVWKSRYRLKKKFGLVNTKNLESFIATI